MSPMMLDMALNLARTDCLNKRDYRASIFSASFSSRQNSSSNFFAGVGGW